MISCPSDVKTEVEIIQKVVDNINNSIGDGRGIRTIVRRTKTIKKSFFEEDSFGKYVMEGTEGFYWLNNKNRDGVKKKRYKLNKKDIETKNKFHRYGSIVGSKIVVKIDSKEYIQALLTISTYGKKIYDDPFEIDRERLERQIEDVILPVFKIDIESELLQIYLEEMSLESGIDESRISTD